MSPFETLSANLMANDVIPSGLDRVTVLSTTCDMISRPPSQTMTQTGGFPTAAVSVSRNGALFFNPAPLWQTNHLWPVNGTVYACRYYLEQSPASGEPESRGNLTIKIVTPPSKHAPAFTPLSHHAP